MGAEAELLLFRQREHELVGIADGMVVVDSAAPLDFAGAIAPVRKAFAIETAEPAASFTFADAGLNQRHPLLPVVKLA